MELTFVCGAQLIVGRICLGIGIGLSVQCVPLYISEVRLLPSVWICPHVLKEGHVSLERASHL